MGFIKHDFIERLQERIHIDEVVSDFVKLERAGANFKAKSPFNDADKTASFMVSPAKQIFKCFSTGKGGNAIAFVMEKTNCTYPEAIEYLAKKYNETVEYENPEYAQKKAEETSKKDKQRSVLTHVYEIYRNAYRKLDDNHPGRIEVETKRQYDQDTIIEWGIAYAPENSIYDKLSGSGNVSVGKAIGLISSKENSIFEMYSNRVVYPIHDKNGLLIGLSGRDLSDNKKMSKWINPPVSQDNFLYNKSGVWYGLHKAMKSIRQKNEAWIVEGYNDVISWHLLGIENTVAPCGTAITTGQINELSKITTKVIFCMDPDKAGIDSMLKHIPLFIERNMQTEVVVLPCDPDDFSRIQLGSFEAYEPYVKMVTDYSSRKNGFSFLMEHMLKGSDLDISKGVKELCKLISKVTDTAYREIYSSWLQKESKTKMTAINKWIKEAEETAAEEKTPDTYVNIELPKGVKKSIAELRDDILKYGMFIDSNQIYMSIGEITDKVMRFVPVSNFTIEILQHMNDEKQPMKLLRLKNIFNEERIFDTLSENLNTPQAFDNMVTGHGNFRFDGDRKQLLRLRTYLFDKMGTGRKIDVLGWQPDGKFWAWNNKITDENGSEIPMTEHGIFVKENTHYYIPSANVVYKNNKLKFESQKRFKKMDNPVSFPVYLMKVKEVHRDHAISGILFAIASVFQDIVVDKVEKFPLLFLYGPGSTGKDELAAIVQGFTGVPQTAINLEGNVSTIKAQVREFAQFRNGISQLSEYKRGNPQLDGMLKAIWDRRGYKRGNIESHVGTESIPIESSAILTGNDFPNEEPLILRLIWNEMTKNQFSDEEMKRFDELRDMTAPGISGYTDWLFQYRTYFEEEFEKSQRSWKGILTERFPEAKGRIHFNLSILASVYTLFKDKVNFPFTQEEMLEHFAKGIDQQIRKINAASILNRFWDCFIASLRGHKEQRLQVGYIVNIEGNHLFFNWKHTMAVVNLRWWNEYREAPPAVATLKEQIEKHPAFVRDEKTYSFTPGRSGNRTSAVVIDMDKLSEDVKSTIIGSVIYQKNESDSIRYPAATDSNLFDPPATPGEEKILKDGGDLPF